MGNDLPDSNRVSLSENIYEGLQREEIFAAWCYLHRIAIKDCRKECTGHDYIIQLGARGVKVDVKSYRKPFYLAIEESNKAIDGRNDTRPGSIYTSEADYFVFVGFQSLQWLRLQPFKLWWEQHKADYALLNNKPSTNKLGQVWQGSFRYVSIDAIKEFVIAKELA